MFHGYGCSQRDSFYLPVVCWQRGLKPEFRIILNCRWLDAVIRDVSRAFLWRQGLAGGGDGISGGEAGGDLLVEVEELGEEVRLGGEAVGGEHGGIQRGVGVLERIGAGEFEGAIERAQPALEFRQVCGTDAADLQPGCSDCGDGFLAWILRPWKGVENRGGGVIEALGELRAFRHEPQPMGVGLEDAEAIVVLKGEDAKFVIGANGAGNKCENRAFGRV